MRKYFFLFVCKFLFGINCLAQYDHQNIFLLGHFYDSTVVAEPNHGTKYQACYGWTDTLTGKEYGVIGSTAGTYIVPILFYAIISLITSRNACGMNIKPIETTFI
jgi:hypothetical protein